jgi:hypothetical protein
MAMLLFRAAEAHETNKFDKIFRKYLTDIRKRADASVDIGALALAEPSALRQAEGGLQ